MNLFQYHIEAIDQLNNVSGAYLVGPVGAGVHMIPITIAKKLNVPLVVIASSPVLFNFKEHNEVIGISNYRFLKDKVHIPDDCLIYVDEIHQNKIESKVIAKVMESGRKYIIRKYGCDVKVIHIKESRDDRS